MKTENVGAAFIASLIPFFSAIVALFTENPDLTLAGVKEATWIVLVAGGISAFLKDYYSMLTRGAIGKAMGKS